MKFLILLAMLCACEVQSFAQTTLILRNPVNVAASLNTTTTSVTNGAYVQLIAAASVTYASNALILSNSGAQPLALAKGAAASEVLTGIVIPPASYGTLIPIQLPKATRLSVKSMDSTQSAGFVTVGFLQ